MRGISELSNKEFLGLLNYLNIHKIETACKKFNIKEFDRFELAKENERRFPK